MDCLFCKIAHKKLDSKIVYENKGIIVIEDINPQAKVHLLIFPKKHIADSADDKEADKILRQIFQTIRQVAKAKKIDKSGYRIVTNHKNDAGQTVAHLHFHLLGGEKLSGL